MDPVERQGLSSVYSSVGRNISDDTADFGRPHSRGIPQYSVSRNISDDTADCGRPHCRGIPLYSVGVKDISDDTADRSIECKFCLLLFRFTLLQYRNISFYLI